jgi:hypothetical protein
MVDFLCVFKRIEERAGAFVDPPNIPRVMICFITLLASYLRPTDLLDRSSHGMCLVFLDIQDNRRLHRFLRHVETLKLQIDERNKKMR